jgi:RNA polymerase sigma factor (sigma-70 family)
MPKLLQTSAMRQIQRVFSQGTATGLSDAQLLERFAGDRDEAAFELLVARHGPMVLGVCRGVLHDPHDAEDAFQATFLVLARKARSLWVKGSLASWLYQIAIRIAVQSRVDADRRRRHERQAAEVQKREDGTTGRLEPDLIPMLCQEIDRLPEKYRAPVVLCHLEELTHEAAAQVLHCPIGTVHGRLSRARELLRRRLTRRGVTLPLGMAAILSGGESLAATVPEPLRSTTLRAALNLAAGQGVSAAVGSATAGTLLAATLRSMSLRTLETIAAITLTIGVAVCASMIAGQPAEEPGQRQHDRSLPATFDKPRFDRIVPGGKNEPLFVDFDTGHFLSPPFTLEPVDHDRPLTVSNLAFPEKLKDWVRRHGIDAAVQTDGRTITLLGLEMNDGQPVPNPNAWPILTIAEALKLIGPSLDQPRRHDAGEWPRFARAFQPGDPPVVLPFLTREGGLGLLGLRMDRADPKDIEGIRLTYQLGRGLVPRGDDLATGRAIRRPPVQALLDDPAGPVHLQTWKGGIVLTRPGCPEWIEIDQGKVVVKVNRAGLAGPAADPETLIEASRLVTDVMDLDGRRLRAKLAGSSKAMICRRVRDRLEIGEVDSRLPMQPLIVKPDSILGCDRITLDLPYFQHLSKDPRVDAIVHPKGVAPLRLKR